MAFSISLSFLSETGEGVILFFFLSIFHSVFRNLFSLGQGGAK